MKYKLFTMLWFTFIISSQLHSQIHNAPIVIAAKKIPAAQFYATKSYRLFKSDEKGNAVMIPFQIDQKDAYEDYVLDQGKRPNTKGISNVFKGEDELSFMGDDVGPKQRPTKWSVPKPNALYELSFHKEGTSATDRVQDGAVYLGIYYSNPPPLSDTKYVEFDLVNAKIKTSHYEYLFNNSNYLVVRGVNIFDSKKKESPIILSSSVFMRLDLKYFLTVDLGHSDIQSELDAYKVGPVRAIARVNFDYKLLKMKIDLGMYTEVSFFMNSVYLPAVIDNPIDGKNMLNRGSYFYYGLALVENPSQLDPKSNMPSFDNKKNYTKVEGKNADSSYWVSAVAPKYTVYMEFVPSEEMEKKGNIPKMFADSVDGKGLMQRKTKPQALGKSPVNVAVAFGLKDFNKGLHKVQFRVFLENESSPQLLESFRTSHSWKPTLARHSDF